MRKFLQEFKAFTLKGNVINLAVGIIIGASFQNMVTSLTTNILSPIIGMFARQNFDSLAITILDVPITYGAFITSILNFVIMAFVVFLLVKIMNAILTYNKKDSDTETPITKKCPFCLSEINIKATRCPFCTSELSAPEDKE
jgi:large conductance mechanosensitive channel